MTPEQLRRAEHLARVGGSLIMSPDGSDWTGGDPWDVDARDRGRKLYRRNYEKIFGADPKVAPPMLLPPPKYEPFESPVFSADTLHDQFRAALDRITFQPPMPSDSNEKIGFNALIPDTPTGKVFRPKPVEEETRVVVEWHGIPMKIINKADVPQLSPVVNNGDGTYSFSVPATLDMRGRRSFKLVPKKRAKNKQAKKSRRKRST